jgi:DHA2 family methylenomycin A resistance protein-like MFS transporter
MARGGPNYRLVILLVGLTQLIITTDFSIIAVALPSIGQHLHIPPESLSWVISASALTFGGFLILAGRAADILGQRRCLLVGLAMFGAGSLAVSMSTDLPMLIGARALQGLGGAILTPANFSLINTLVPEGAPRRQALGVFGIMQGLSLVIGLLIGGAMTTHFGWRSVFLLNPPIAALAMLLTFRAVPPARAVAADDRVIDWLGAGLIMAGMGLMLSAVSLMGRQGWTAPLPLGLLAAGLAAFGLFFLAESRARAPLAPLSIFGRRNFAPANFILLLHLAGVGGVFVLTSLYMQTGLKLSAMQSGLGMMPYAAAVMLAGQTVAPIMARAPHRVIVIGGFGLYALGLTLLALLCGQSNYWIALALGSVVCGFGSTTSFMALMAEATADVPATQQGAASAILFTAQQIGVPLGATVALSVLGAAGAASSGLGMHPFRDGYLAVAAIIGLGLAISLLALRRTPPAPAPGLILP